MPLAKKKSSVIRLIKLAAGQLRSRWQAELFLRQSGICPIGNSYMNLSTKVVLFTIAFNNPWYLYKQSKLVRKNIIDPHLHVVVDNSFGNYHARNKEIALRFDNVYVQLPQNPYSTVSGSASHGLALNWCVRNIIRHVDCDVVGFIDHDNFPYARHSIIDAMGLKTALGVLQTRSEKWYLWPGFMFYRREIFEKYAMGFLPIPGLDTGGEAYEKCFSKMNKSSVLFATQAYEKLCCDDDHGIAYETFMNSWVHPNKALNIQSFENSKRNISRLISSLSL